MSYFITVLPKHNQNKKILYENNLYLQNFIIRFFDMKDVYMCDCTHQQVEFEKDYCKTYLELENEMD